MLIPALAALLVAAADPAACTIDIVAEVGLERTSPCDGGALAVGDRLRLGPGGVLRLLLPDGELTCVQRDGTSAWAELLLTGPVAVDGEPWTCRRAQPIAETSGFVTKEAPARVTTQAEQGERGSDDDAPVVSDEADADTPEATAPADAARDDAAEDPEASADDPAAAPARLPLLFVELEARRTPDSVTGILDQVIITQLEREGRIDMSDSASLEALLARASELAAADTRCGEAADACVLRVADALGARYVLTGSVSADDRLLQVQLVLLDSEAAEVLARADYRAANVVMAGDVLPDAVHNVLRPLLGGEERKLPAPPPNRTLGASETLQGAAVTGTAAAVGMGLTWAPAACAAPVCAASGGLGAVGSGLLICMLGAPCYGPPVAMAGVALGAVLGDNLFGFEASTPKALLLAAAGGGLSLSTSLAAIGAQLAVTFFLVTGYVAATGSTNGIDERFMLALAGAALAILTAGLAVAIAGAIGLAVGFAFLTPLLAPRPDPLGGPDDGWLAAREVPPTITVAQVSQRF